METKKSINQDLYKDKIINNTFEITQELISNGFQISNDYVINIGSHDGKSMKDPCYPYYTALNYSGICIDYGAFPEIYNNLPMDSVKKIMSTKLTPYNIIRILKENETPKHVHFLKIDIDSFDGVILERILSRGYSADIIQVEINPDIPPPIRFSMYYHKMGNGGCKGGFYGASASYVQSLTKKRGYIPLYIDNSEKTHDLILVSRDIFSNIGLKEKSLKEIFEHSDKGFSHLYGELGIDCQAWRSEKDMVRLTSSIWSVMSYASLVKNGSVLPFLLEVGDE